MKKEIYFLTGILIFLFCSSTLVNAQSCSADQVLMSRGCICGHKKSQCQSQCVKPNQVQSLLKRGWYFGECTGDCCPVIKTREKPADTQLANASGTSQKGQSFVCNCSLPDYGCKGNKKCLSSCYRSCELGWIVSSDRSGQQPGVETKEDFFPDSSFSLLATDNAGNQLPCSSISNASVWEVQNNSNVRPTSSNGELTVRHSSSCTCSVVGYGCRDWDFKCRDHCYKVCSKH